MSKYDKFEGHTPGPWERSTNFKDSVNSLNPEKHIAMINHYHCNEPVDIHGKEYEANKALIMAAPDLLAACKRKDELLRRAMEQLHLSCNVPLTDEIYDELNREEI